LNDPDFTIWLVRSNNDSQSIGPFHGGALDNPYGHEKSRA
jgi:hypothetical protein